MLTAQATYKLFAQLAVLMSLMSFAVARDARGAAERALPMTTITNLDEITSIRVLSFPERDFVRIALTPELITANYRSYFQLGRTEARWGAFERSVQGTTLTPTQSIGDHRWAVLFRDGHGRIKYTLAIDRLRHLANLDGNRYEIHGELLGWLKRQSGLLVPRSAP